MKLYKTLLLTLGVLILVGCGNLGLGNTESIVDKISQTVVTKGKYYEDLKEDIEPRWGIGIELEGVDLLGRPRKAEAVITYDTLRPSKGRPSINIDPVGFKNRKIYNGGKGYYVYDRSHLIGYTLYDSELTETRDNLITGTVTLNKKYMSQVENAVRDYAGMGVKVYYSVEPLYNQSDLVPYGVHIKALSEDGSLKVNRIIYNIEDGVEINYLTGYVSVTGAINEENINEFEDQTTTQLLLEEGKGFSFDSCKIAKENGYSSIKRGEYGYGEHLDRDGDGVACE